MDATEGSGGLNLAERIRRLANGRSTLDVAQFQYIGLEQIRTSYAERWPGKRERVARVAQHFISRRVAVDDVLIAGADGFLVVFGGLTGQIEAEGTAGPSGKGVIDRMALTRRIRKTHLWNGRLLDEHERVVASVGEKLEIPWSSIFK